ncbi:acyl carrier protein [Williamsoniiplasma somnilux]|uniref:Acyl carrier protein n=1 Tax=Williamsoniiplasma somnilux TaxID=215578 RepID=A0A2K8NXQ2_9MOLU|nr:acyl carrier protein [Williamsoniiplasma somnilux]ATZ18567.1 acyl carrier protein [Williamsoniiplasma somnilux]
MNIYEEILKALKKAGAKGTLDKNTRFANVGVDSLDLMDMIVKLEDTLEIRVPDDELLTIKTIEDLLNIIEKLKG